MARHSRPKPDEVVQVCYGIHPQTKEVVTIFGRRNGSYSLGNHTYSNQQTYRLKLRSTSSTVLKWNSACSRIR
jgi:hypothetical protein